MLQIKVKEYIVKNQLFSENDLLLIAVSGGRDSIALLHVLKKLNYKIEVAHCNFCLRGKESDEEAEFVQQLCKEMNIPFHLKIFDTKTQAAISKESIQMTARSMRYDWFNELLLKIKADKIVSAHHLDDQIETFFINFSRGTGIKGLVGIPLKRAKIVRPFLPFNRDEINNYLSENKIEYRDDSSNVDNKYLRNKIRSTFTPTLKKINPSFYESFANTRHKLEQVANFWQKGFEDWKSKNVVMEGDNHLILKQKENYGFFEQYLSDFNFTSSDIKNITELNPKAIGKYFFTDQYKLLLDRKYWILTRQSKEENINYKVDCDILPIPLKITTKKDTEKLQFSNTKICIDADKIIGKLRLRHWLEGDYFIPFGMIGKKKLSDYFIDQKINRLDKDKIWLLCDEKNIIWLVGLRMDNRYKISAETKVIIEIQTE